MNFSSAKGNPRKQRPENPDGKPGEYSNQTQLGTSDLWPIALRKLSLPATFYFWWRGSMLGRGDLLHRCIENPCVWLFRADLFPLVLTASTDQEVHTDARANAGELLQAFQTFWTTATKKQGSSPPFSPRHCHFQIFPWELCTFFSSAEIKASKQTRPLPHFPPASLHPLLASCKYLNHCEPHPASCG